MRVVKRIEFLKSDIKLRLLNADTLIKILTLYLFLI